MSEWGTRIDIPIFDNRIQLDNPVDIQQYEYDCNDSKCLNYMYNNGKTIFDETDKYINVSDNVFSEKIKMLFNTDNSIKSRMLNDAVIEEIQQSILEQLKETHSHVDKNYIINHILYILKPYLLNNTTIDFDVLKQDIINTIIFKLNYMSDITTQLEFLLLLM